MLDGSGGIDTADYSTSERGVLVSLLESIGSSGDASGDIYSSIENVTGSAKDDRLVGDAGRNILKGLGGADFLDGEFGVDVILGGGGNDTIRGGGDADQLDGGSGVDTLDYSNSVGEVVVDLALNTAAGHAADGDTIKRFENLIGSTFADRLVGSDATNSLSGGADNDRLDGGLGVDRLTGGQDGDILDFNSTADSKVGLGSRDVITDFQPGEDKIDLLSIDAKAGTSGNQAFTLIGGTQFTAEGQVRFFFEGDHTVVALNTIGTGGAELHIELSGHVSPAAADFIL